MNNSEILEAIQAIKRKKRWKSVGPTKRPELIKALRSQYGIHISLVELAKIINGD